MVLSFDRLGFFEGITRVLGHGQVRLILQPLLAIVAGIRLGIADAREDQAPFVIRLFRNRSHVLRRAFSDIIVPFAIAIVIDSILQYTTLGYVRPLAAVLVALLLVWLPFSTARGVTNRLVHGHVRTVRES